MAEKIDFDLTVKNNQLDKALDSGIQKASRLEGTLDTALAVFAGNVATKGFEAVVSGLRSLVAVGEEAIDAAAAQEVATNNLNNSLARAGQFSKAASADLLAFASSMQSLTVFEDDAVIASTALLQSLTRLDKEGLKQGVSAAADFATVLGIDLESATRLVGKAAEGNISAFKRYGVEIKQGATDSETFANTIQALNTQFGGAAAAQLTTYTGSLKALKNSYGDLLEPIGDIVVKNPLIIASFNEIKNIINGTNEEITGSVPAFQEFLNNGIFAVSSGAQVFLDILDFLTVGIKQFTNVLQIVDGSIASSIVDPLRDMIDGFLFLAQNIPGIGDEFKNLENPIAGAAKAIQDFTQNGVAGLQNATGDNVFRSLSEGIDQFTGKIIDNSAQVKIAQNEVKNSNTARVADEAVTSQAILDQRLQLANDIRTLNQQLADEQANIDAQRDVIKQDEGINRREAEIQAIFDQKMRENTIVYQAELDKAALIADADAKQLAADKAMAAKRLADKKATDSKEYALEVARGESLKQARSDTFAAIATLSSANNKTLATIGKAAAITQIAIDGPQAVVKALAAFPPPFNFAAAGLVGAAVAAQAARVAGVAFANGGFINGAGGATMGPDTTTAQVRDGEMVLNASQQGKLFDMINGGGGGGDIVIKIDEREIARAVRNQRQQGFAI